MMLPIRGADRDDIRLCAIASCGRQGDCRNLCVPHYQRYLNSSSRQRLSSPPVRNRSKGAGTKAVRFATVNDSR